MASDASQHQGDLFGFVRPPAVRPVNLAGRCAHRHCQLVSRGKQLADQLQTLASNVEDAIDNLRHSLACVNCGDDVSQIDRAIEWLDDELTEAIEQFRLETSRW